MSQKKVRYICQAGRHVGAERCREEIVAERSKLGPLAWIHFWRFHAQEVMTAEFPPVEFLFSDRADWPYSTEASRQQMVPIQ